MLPLPNIHDYPLYSKGLWSDSFSLLLTISPDGKYQSLSFLSTEQPSLCRRFLLNKSSHLKRSLSADQRIFSEVVIRFQSENFKLFQKENLRMIIYIIYINIYKPLKYTNWINWHISGYQNFYEKLGATNNFIYDIISWWGMWSFTKIRLLLLSTSK